VPVERIVQRNVEMPGEFIQISIVANTSAMVAWIYAYVILNLAVCGSGSGKNSPSRTNCAPGHDSPSVPLLTQRTPSDTK